jgi:ankyrin repeat protein
MIVCEWVNRRTLHYDEDFTPVHFAAFNGNIKMIEILTEYGADTSCQTRHRVNVMHVSA